MELESLAIDNCDNELPGLKVESEAREDENDDTVTEASSRVVHMPKKHDRFTMTAAEISFMQIKANLIFTLKLSLIGTTGMALKNMSDLHVMNYNQAMVSADASE